MTESQSELKQRNVSQKIASIDPSTDQAEHAFQSPSIEPEKDKDEHSKKTFGRTPDGHVFTVPETRDMVSQLLSPSEPKNVGDIAVIAVLAVHIAALYLIPKPFKIPAFAAIYLFWRASYNIGIGYLLKTQSNNRQLVRWAAKLRLFEDPAKGQNPHPGLYRFIKKEMEAKIPHDYKFDEAPIEFNTWLVFRRLTDLILMSDFVSYCCFAVAATNNPPPGEHLANAILRWSTGIGLVLFNLWVKLDAHRVVKDYAWYWGDFFFLIDQELTFDGVFEMAPHPMYTIGYAGYYGISFMAASYKVFLISLVAHAAQLAFLYWVEDPHIEKTYTPQPPNKRLLEEPAKSTPSGLAKAGENANESTSTDLDSWHVLEKQPPPMRNLLGKNNMDLFRLTDSTTILLQLYLVLFTVMTPITPRYQIFFAIQAAVWRLWYSIGLGYILNSQSLHKTWTRHFVKYGESTGEAWRHWQGLYHISLNMTWGSYIALFWKVYTVPTDWQSDWVLLSHVLGIGLVALQTWTAISIYDSLGEFGWFFGDFFFDQAPKLTYSGIYRYLNNPERVIGLAGLWGAWLVTRNNLILMLAVMSHVLSIGCLQFVERPHMQRLYGRSLRSDSGLSKSFRRSLPTGLRKWQGNLDRIMDNSFDFVEEFIDSAKPRIAAGVTTFVKDSTSLFKHPTRLTITRLEPDMAGYDPKDYSIDIVNGTPSADGKAVAFAYGEPIRVKWTAPLNHSRKDWIGLYRVADNASWKVTRVSSAGRWISTNPDQYDGSEAAKGILDSDVRVAGSKRHDGESKDYLAGEMEFSGEKLFWTQEAFEFRYHHNSKHNVMAISRAFEVRIHRYDDEEIDFNANPLALNAVENELLPLIRNCLDRDPNIAPNNVTEGYGTVVAHDPKYARRIVYAVGRMFGIEFAQEAILADGNVRNLARRIFNAKKVLAPYSMSRSHSRDTPMK